MDGAPCLYIGQSCHPAHAHVHSTARGSAYIFPPTIKTYTFSMTSHSAHSTTDVLSGISSNDSPSARPSARRSTRSVTVKYSADTDYARDEFVGSPRIVISVLSSDGAAPSASALLQRMRARLLEATVLREGRRARTVLAQAAQSELRAALMESGFSEDDITLEYDARASKLTDAKSIHVLNAQGRPPNWWLPSGKL